MSIAAMGFFRFFVCLFLLLLSAVSQADFTSNSGDNDQATSEIITMTGAAYAGDVWVLDINYPISKTITYVAGSIATGKNILNAAIGFAAQINADSDASQILTAIAVDSTEGYAAEVHLEMIEGLDGFDSSVSVTGNNGRELSVSITNNSILNDTDSDGDGILNSFDVFPYDSTEWLDTDLDGIGNNTDVDDDNDGILDIVDIWPEDTRYSKDTDMDGMPDSYEESYQFNIYDASDATYDPDEDGMGAFSEFLLNTSPRYWDSDGDGQPDASDDANDYVIDLSSDTDNDGLVNSEEILLRTSYKNSDTDLDGMPDGWEIENNRNPIIADYQISSGNDHTCALDDTGVVCWGNNHLGQIDVPQLLNPTQISAGFNHNCAIDDTGVVCWGSNSHGQTNVPNLISPKFVKSNRYYSCAVDAHEVKCWGHINGLPEDVSTSEEIILGHSFVCGINKGELICSGSNSDGQLNLPNERYVSDASLGNNHGCAVFDGDVKCWGRNHFGMAEPTVLNNPTVISVNRVHSCAVDSAGVKCWGRSDNFSGMPELNGVLQLSAGDEHTCAIDSSGVHCWGHNDAGERDVPELIFDFDRDGYKNNHDIFPLDSTEQEDTDDDGIGNNADTDDDGDGIADVNDAFPTNSLYYADSDNDGMADEWEVLYGLNPNDPSDTASDQDDDGAVALQEFIEGTVPVIDSDDDGVADHLDVFPNDPTEALDSDEDGVGDNTDNCTDIANTDQADFNNDGAGDACYDDITPPTFASLDTAESISENSGENQLIYRAIAYDCRENVCSPPEPLSFTFEPDSVTNAQQVYVSSISISEDSMQAVVTLSYKSDDPTTRGIGFDLFYDSSALSMPELDWLQQMDHYQFEIFPDHDNLDNNSLTDMYISSIWSSLFEQFPGSTKTDLYQLTFGIVNGARGSPLNILSKYSDTISEIFYSSSISSNHNRNNIEYSLSSNSDPELTINSENGWVTLLNNPDFEAKSSYQFTTIATDPSGNTSELQVTMHLLNKDEVAPVITSSDEASIYENSGTNQVIYTAIADDTSDVSSGVSYSLIDKTDYDDAEFWIPNIVNSDEVQNFQQIYVSKSFINTETNRAEVTFSYNSDDPTTTGLGFDVIFDASKLSLLDVKDHLATDTFIQASNVTFEDGFGSVTAAWSSLFGTWPGVNKVDLFTLVFETTSNAIGSEITIDILSSSWCCQDIVDSFYLKQSPPLNINSLTGDVSLMINPDFSSRQSFIFDVIATDNAGYISEPQTVTLNILEADTDLDGTLDSLDNCPEIFNPTQLDTDNDLLGDVCDSDDDNDGTQDSFDALPLDPTEQLDHDNDGVGNNKDTDDDGDGVNDALDLFPLDAFESADSDGDGVGDNADFFPNLAEYSLDSDLDQMPDAWERKYGLNPTDASDALLDQDNDGLTALEEYEAGTIPLKILDIDANGSVDALTDGLIILRYLFGLRGDNLVNSATASDAMRTEAADIEAYIQSLMPDF